MNQEEKKRQIKMLTKDIRAKITRIEKTIGIMEKAFKKCQTN